MSVDRNFHNFDFRDNVYDLAGGMVPDLLERAALPVGEQPDLDTLGKLVGALGKNKVLRENVEVEFLTQDEMVGYVEQAGTQLALDRAIDGDAEEAIGIFTPRIVTGAVANWQDRVVKLLVDGEGEGEVYVVLGNREMGSKTELENSNVKVFRSGFGYLPTEAQYGELFVVPALEERGLDVSLHTFDTNNGNEIAQLFVAEKPELFSSDHDIAFARVANAGIQLAVQFRTAARHIYPGFDTTIVQTDSLPVARTEEQRANPKQYQAPQTGLRQAILTAKLLHEAQLQARAV